MKKTSYFLFFFLIYGGPWGWAQTYEELTQAVQAVKVPGRQIAGLNERQLQVRRAWETGKLIDDYLLERSARAVELVNQLAADLKDDPSRLYYTLQFVRAYPEAPPALDLHWGFYQYLLAINDPREREELAGRAFREKWNWDRLRAEVKKANRDNKEFIFTTVPGKTGVYRVMRAKRGAYRGQLVLDLGFSNYYLPDEPLKFKEYEIIEATCSDFPAERSCTFKSAAGREGDLFNYKAETIQGIDGDTLQAVVDLGFGITAIQMLRLWGVDAPEINTREGRKAKKALEEWVMPKPIRIRAVRMEKYGRYLADVWSFAEEKKKPLYVNQALMDRGLAAVGDRKER